MGKTEQPKTNSSGDAPGSESRGTPTFTHLHLHTEYSLLDGGNQVDKLVDRIAELGMTSCAITDHGNMFGAAVFYQACKDKGIKPILGVEAYVTPPGKPRQDRTYSGGGEGGYHLVLLAMNNVGWQNLLVLCSEAYLTGFYYKPRIDRELLAKHSEGLIAINGHLGSEIGEHLLAFERTGDDKYWNLAKESAEWHKKAFGIGHQASGKKEENKKAPASNTYAQCPMPDASIPRFYVELQHHVPEQNAINKWLIKLAREMDVPLVCDNDAHFLREDDYNTHDTLICISTGKGKQDNNRMRYPREVFVKSPAEMAELFAGDEYNTGAYKNAGLEALANTQRIADACNVTLAIGANHAPMVRVVLPKPKDLPRHDDPRYAGDLTAWYADYCSKFELKPFQNEDGSEITEADKAKAKADCDAALRLLAEGGFIWRYGRAPSTIAESRTPNAGSQDDHAAKVARLERELKILADKNISAYFLIVWDFVNWGRSNGVPALARGSGVGTMVGYVLGLSNACPVRYGLLFERFTDPDRSEYPDIDIDLCQDGRGRVIDYVRRKYGHVAQIITFGTLKARAAIKDVGRVLEIPLAEVDRISKLVPEQLGITIEEAIKKEPELAGLYNKDLRIKDLLDQAIALEGHTRHAGVHAAGVIVATRPLHEIVPLYKQTAKEKNAGSGNEVDAVITQWDGPTCEKMGLLKMDFLGLRTISVVARAKKLIRETMSEGEIWEAVGRREDWEKLKAAKQQSSNKKKTDDKAFDALSFSDPLDLDRLSFADQRVFEIFRRGETTGVFQFESGGMRRLLVEMKPDRLEDLIAANALFRPGPMDLIPDYNRRKHGTEDVPKVHAIVDQYTNETYGVMVYQEQVMQIVHGLGGIKLRDAYSLIKNISKKKHDKIEKERPKFIEGAVKQGLTKDGANDLFELILKFAGYGFNKSHSTGYAIVAYQTAYLKCFYPAQYMAAFLTYESQANKASDWIPYLEDCRRMRLIDPSKCGSEERNPATVATGIEVKPPDISLSHADFAVVGMPTLQGASGSAAKGSESAVSSPGSESRGTQATHIRFGLKAIKGIGEKAIDAIIAERENSGVFTSLFDFCERVPPGAISKAMLESLIKCGAFDSVHGRENRAAMVGTIDSAITAGQRLAQDKAAGQSGLFGLGGDDKSKVAQTSTKSATAQAPLARVTPWPEKDLLTYEKDVLGFYVSSHPLERWKFWFEAFASANTARLKELQQDARVVLPCMIQSVRPIVVRNGKSAGQKMAILTVEDHTGAADCVLFTDNYSKYGHLAEADKVVYVLGRLDLSRGDPQVVVDRLVPIEGVPYDNGKVRLFIDEVRLNGEAANTLNRVAMLLRAQDTASAAATDPKSKPAAQIESKATETLIKNAQAGTRFPVEVIIGTESSVAIIAADPRLRVELKPEFIKAMETELGAGMVKVVGGFTVEKDKKPWENSGKRKFSRDEE